MLEARYGWQFVLAAGLSIFVALAASCSSAQTSPALEDPTEDTIVEAQPDNNALKLVAHRGLHHTFAREGIDNDTCTAERIYPVEHEYIENTLPSMQAAFDLGAVVVEIDIAATSDGVLAVFHDWSVDCRTDGTGDVRSLTWAELSQLDVGYGYTSDGQNFPLRGQAAGLLPRLEEVLAEFPDGQFLINFKSNDPAEAELLDAVVREADAAHQVWAVYGGPVAVETYLSRTSARGFTETSIATCVTQSMLSPDDLAPECSNSVILVPLDIAGALPGWPDQYVEEMADRGTHVVIVGAGLASLSGVDTAEAFATIPEDLDVYVWTDRIDVVGTTSLNE